MVPVAWRFVKVNGPKPGFTSDWGNKGGDVDLVHAEPIKEGVKIIVGQLERVGVPNLIEKGYNVESARRSGKSLADGVNIGSSRTKEGAESIVGWRERGHAKVTSSGRRRGGPTSEVAGLEIAVNNEVVGGS